jgi:hypothetical protein
MKSLGQQAKARLHLVDYAALRGNLGLRYCIGHLDSIDYRALKSIR